MEQGPLSIQGSRFPLGHRFRNRCWTPLMTTLVNRSGDGSDVTVVYSLSVQGEAGSQVGYSRTVWLPARSRREVVQNVFLDLETDEILKRFLDKNGRLNIKEEPLRFADGTEVMHKHYRMRKPFRMQVELFQGEDAGGAKVGQTEMFCVAVHPDALNIFLVEALPEMGALDAVYERDGHRYVYGEIEDDLSRSATVYGGMSTRNTPPPDLLQGRPIAKGAISITHLPRKWAAFQGLHALVLASPRDYRGGLGLDPQQQASLLRWIWSGGRVILLPSTDPEMYAHPFFEKLLPVRLEDVRRQHAMPALAEHYGGEVPFRTDVPHVRIEALPGDGRSLVQDEEYSYVARRQVGGGEVWFAAVNGEALRDWRQNLDLFADMLQPSPSPVPGLETALAENVPDLMQQIVGIETPRRIVVVVLLFAYAFLGTVLLLWLRQRGQAEWAWPAVVVLSVLALGVALWRGEAAGAKTGLVQGEVGVTVLGNRKGTASSIGFVSVFSPHTFKTDARFLNPDTLATAFSGGAMGKAGRQAFVSSLNIKEADRFYLQGLRINERELFTCRSMTLARYGKGLGLDFGYDAAGLSGRIINRTGEDLRDCLLVANRAILRLGDLPDGETRSFDDTPVALTGHLSSQEFVTDASAETRSRILSLLRRIPRLLAAEPGNHDTVYAWPPTFYGWVNKPQALVSFGDEREPKQRALQVLALPADRVLLPDKGEVHVPPGLCPLVFSGYAGRRVYGVAVKKTRKFTRRAHGARPGGRSGTGQPRPGATPQGRLSAAPTVDPREKYRSVGWLPVEGPLSFEVGFLRPAGTADVHFSQAWLHVDVNARNLSVSVSACDYRATKGEKVVWKKLDVEADGGRVRLPDTKRLLGTGEEVARVRMMVRPARGQAATEGLSGVKWNIRTLDLELAGRVRAGEKE